MDGYQLTTWVLGASIGAIGLTKTISKGYWGWFKRRVTNQEQIDDIPSIKEGIIDLHNKQAVTDSKIDALKEQITGVSAQMHNDHENLSGIVQQVVETNHTLYKTLDDRTSKHDRIVERTLDLLERQLDADN